MNTKWPMVKLGEVLSQYTEYIDAPEPREYPKLSVKLYGRGVVLDTPANGATLKMMRHQIAKAGQVVLSEIWGKKGAIGFVPDEGEGALCTSHFFLFDITSNKLDRQWLQAIFESNYLESQLDAESKGTTGYAAVRPKILLACEIPLPPLPEQRRIVARIEELAAKINEARGLRQKAEGETEVLVASSTSHLCSSKSATRITVGELVGIESLRNGKSVKSTVDFEEFRCLALSAMRQGRIDVRETKPVPFTRREAQPYLINKGDVFVMRGNGSKHLCGQAGLVTEESNSVIFPDLFIRVPLPVKRILPKFFVAVWNSAATRKVIEEKAKTTSGIWKVNQGHTASTEIPIPPLSDQRRIVAELEALQSQMDVLKKLQAETDSELDALLPSVLDKAFKGKL